MVSAQKPQASKWRLLLGGALLPLVMGGCQSMSNTDKGVLAGGGLGAGAGALIGSATHHTGAGAVLGGVVGAIAGGLTGSAIDNSERKQAAANAAAVAAANQPPPLSLEDVQKLSQNGTRDEIIINQIRTSGSVYRLTADQILWLQTYGVHDSVIREMQATAYRAPRAVYTATPVYQPVYVYEPAPPPVVGVGFSYGRRW
jgi:uncharacterized protein YcfJ